MCSISEAYVYLYKRSAAGVKKKLIIPAFTAGRITAAVGIAYRQTRPFFAPFSALPPNVIWFGLNHRTYEELSYAC